MSGFEVQQVHDYENVEIADVVELLQLEESSIPQKVTELSADHLREILKAMLARVDRGKRASEIPWEEFRILTSVIKKAPAKARNELYADQQLMRAFAMGVSAGQARQLTLALDSVEELRLRCVFLRDESQKEGGSPLAPQAFEAIKNYLLQFPGEKSHQQRLRVLENVRLKDDFIDILSKEQEALIYRLIVRGTTSPAPEDLVYEAARREKPVDAVAALLELRECEPERLKIYERDIFFRRAMSKLDQFVEFDGEQVNPYRMCLDFWGIKGETESAGAWIGQKEATGPSLSAEEQLVLDSDLLQATVELLRVHLKGARSWLAGVRVRDKRVLQVLHDFEKTCASGRWRGLLGRAGIHPGLEVARRYETQTGGSLRLDLTAGLGVTEFAEAERVLTLRLDPAVFALGTSQTGRQERQSLDAAMREVVDEGVPLGQLVARYALEIREILGRWVVFQNRVTLVKGPWNALVRLLETHRAELVERTCMREEVFQPNRILEAYLQQFSASLSQLVKSSTAADSRKAEMAVLFGLDDLDKAKKEEVERLDPNGAPKTDEFAEKFEGHAQELFQAIAVLGVGDPEKQEGTGAVRTQLEVCEGLGDEFEEFYRRHYGLKPRQQLAMQLLRVSPTSKRRSWSRELGMEFSELEKTSQGDPDSWKCLDGDFAIEGEVSTEFSLGEAKSRAEQIWEIFQGGGSVGPLLQKVYGTAPPEEKRLTRIAFRELSGGVDMVYYIERARIPWQSEERFRGRADSRAQGDDSQLEAAAEVMRTGTLSFTGELVALAKSKEYSRLYSRVQDATAEQKEALLLRTDILREIRGAVSVGTWDRLYQTLTQQVDLGDKLLARSKKGLFDWGTDQDGMIRDIKEHVRALEEQTRASLPLEQIPPELAEMVQQMVATHVLTRCSSLLEDPTVRAVIQDELSGVDRSAMEGLILEAGKDSHAAKILVEGDFTEDEQAIVDGIRKMSLAERKRMRSTPAYLNELGRLCEKEKTFHDAVHALFSDEKPTSIDRLALLEKESRSSVEVSTDHSEDENLILDTLMELTPAEMARLQGRPHLLIQIFRALEGTRNYESIARSLIGNGTSLTDDEEIDDDDIAYQVMSSIARLKYGASRSARSFYKQAVAVFGMGFGDCAQEHRQQIWTSVAEDVQKWAPKKRYSVTAIKDAVLGEADPSLHRLMANMDFGILKGAAPLGNPLAVINWDDEEGIEATLREASDEFIVQHWLSVTRRGPGGTESFQEVYKRYQASKSTGDEHARLAFLRYVIDVSAEAESILLSAAGTIFSEREATEEKSYTTARDNKEYFKWRQILWDRIPTIPSEVIAQAIGMEQEDIPLVANPTRAALTSERNRFADYLKARGTQAGSGFGAMDEGETADYAMHRYGEYLTAAQTNEEGNLWELLSSEAAKAEILGQESDESLEAFRAEKARVAEISAAIAGTVVTAVLAIATGGLATGIGAAMVRWTLSSIASAYVSARTKDAIMTTDYDMSDEGVQEIYQAAITSILTLGTTYKAHQLLSGLKGMSSLAKQSTAVRSIAGKPPKYWQVLIQEGGEEVISETGQGILETGLAAINPALWVDGWAEGVRLAQGEVARKIQEIPKRTLQAAIAPTLSGSMYRGMKRNMPGSSRGRMAGNFYQMYGQPIEMFAEWRAEYMVEAMFNGHLDLDNVGMDALLGVLQEAQEQGMTLHLFSALSASRAKKLRKNITDYDGTLTPNQEELYMRMAGLISDPTPTVEEFLAIFDKVSDEQAQEVVDIVEEVSERTESSQAAGEQSQVVSSGSDSRKSATVEAESATKMEGSASDGPLMYRHKLKFTRYGFDAEYDTSDIRDAIGQYFDLEASIAEMSAEEVIAVFDSRYRGAEKIQGVSGYLGVNMRSNLQDVLASPIGAEFEKELRTDLENEQSDEANQMLAWLGSEERDVATLESFSESLWMGSVINTWLLFSYEKQTRAVNPAHGNGLLQAAFAVSLLARNKSLQLRQGLSEDVAALLGQLEFKFDSQDDMFEMAVRDDVHLSSPEEFEALQKAMIDIFGKPRTYHLHASGGDMNVELMEAVNVLSYYEGWKENPTATTFHRSEQRVHSSAYGFSARLGASKQMVRKMDDNYAEFRALPSLQMLFDNDLAGLQSMAIVALRDESFVTHLRDSNPEALTLLSMQVAGWISGNEQLGANPIDPAKNIQVHDGYEAQALAQNEGVSLEQILRVFAGLDNAVVNSESGQLAVALLVKRTHSALQDGQSISGESAGVLASLMIGNTAFIENRSMGPGASNTVVAETVEALSKHAEFAQTFWSDDVRGNLETRVRERSGWDLFSYSPVLQAYLAYAHEEGYTVPADILGKLEQFADAEGGQKKQFYRSIAAHLEKLRQGLTTGEAWNFDGISDEGGQLYGELESNRQLYRVHAVVSVEVIDGKEVPHFDVQMLQPISGPGQAVDYASYEGQVGLHRELIVDLMNRVAAEAARKGFEDARIRYYRAGTTANPEQALRELSLANRISRFSDANEDGGGDLMDVGHSLSDSEKREPREEVPGEGIHQELASALANEDLEVKKVGGIRILEWSGGKVQFAGQEVFGVMHQISSATGKEVALIRSNSGLFLRLGDHDEGGHHVDISDSDELVVAHTHLNNADWFSSADVQVLDKIGQHSSIIITADGKVVRIGLDPARERSMVQVVRLELAGQELLDWFDKFDNKPTIQRTPKDDADIREVSATVYKRLVLAQKAIDFVKGVIDKGAGNQQQALEETSFQSYHRMQAARGWGTFIGDGTRAAKVLHTRGGNCGEHATLAYEYLRVIAEGETITRVGHSMDHAFVLIGDLSKPDEVVVADPWPIEGNAVMWDDFFAFDDTEVIGEEDSKIKIHESMVADGQSQLPEEYDAIELTPGGKAAVEKTLTEQETKKKIEDGLTNWIWNQLSVYDDDEPISYEPADPAAVDVEPGFTLHAPQELDAPGPTSSELNPGHAPSRIWGEEDAFGGHGPQGIEKQKQQEEYKLLFGQLGQGDLKVRKLEVGVSVEAEDDGSLRPIDQETVGDGTLAKGTRVIELHNGSLIPATGKEILSAMGAIAGAFHREVALVRNGETLLLRLGDVEERISESGESTTTHYTTISSSDELVIAHSHPGSNVNPSRADTEATYNFGQNSTIIIGAGGFGARWLLAGEGREASEETGDLHQVGHTLSGSVSDGGSDQDNSGFYKSSAQQLAIGQLTEVSRQNLLRLIENFVTTQNLEGNDKPVFLDDAGNVVSDSSSAAVVQWNRFGSDPRVALAEIAQDQFSIPGVIVAMQVLGIGGFDPQEFGYPDMELEIGFSSRWAGSITGDDGTVYNLSAQLGFKVDDGKIALIIKNICLFPEGYSGMSRDDQVAHANQQRALIVDMMQKATAVGAENGWDDVILSYSRSANSTSANTNDKREVSLAPRIARLRQRDAGDLADVGHSLSEGSGIYDSSSRTLYLEGLSKYQKHQLIHALLSSSPQDVPVFVDENGETIGIQSISHLALSDSVDGIQWLGWGDNPVLPLAKICNRGTAGSAIVSLLRELGVGGLDPADLGFEGLRLNENDWEGELVAADGTRYEFSAILNVDMGETGPVLYIDSISLFPVGYDILSRDEQRAYANQQRELISLLMAKAAEAGAQGDWADVRISYYRSSDSTSANTSGQRQISLASRIARLRQQDGGDLADVGHSLNEQTGKYNSSTRELSLNGFSNFQKRQLIEALLISNPQEMPIFIDANGENVVLQSSEHADTVDAVQWSGWGEHPMFELAKACNRGTLSRAIVPLLHELGVQGLDPKTLGFEELQLNQNCWEGELVASDGTRYEFRAVLNVGFGEAGPVLHFDHVCLYPVGYGSLTRDEQLGFANQQRRLIALLMTKAAEVGARGGWADVTLSYFRSSDSTSVNTSDQRQISLASRMARLRQQDGGDLADVGHSLHDSGRIYDSATQELSLAGMGNMEKRQIIHALNEHSSTNAPVFLDRDGGVLSVDEMQLSQSILVEKIQWADWGSDPIHALARIAAGKTNAGGFISLLRHLGVKGLDPREIGLDDVVLTGSNWRGKLTADDGTIYDFYADLSIQEGENGPELGIKHICLFPDGYSRLERPEQQQYANQQRQLIALLMSKAAEIGATGDWADVRLDYSRSMNSTSANTRDMRSISLASRIARLRSEGGDLADVGHSLGGQSASGIYDPAGQVLDLSGFSEDHRREVAEAVGQYLKEAGELSSATFYDKDGTQLEDENLLWKVRSIQWAQFGDNPLIALATVGQNYPFRAGIIAAMQELGVGGFDPREFGYPDMVLDLGMGIPKWKGSIEAADGTTYNLSATLGFRVTDGKPTLEISGISLFPQGYAQMDRAQQEGHANQQRALILDMMNKAAGVGAEHGWDDVVLSYIRSQNSTSANTSQKRDVSLASRMERIRQQSGGDLGDVGHSFGANGDGFEPESNTLRLSDSDFAADLVFTLVNAHIPALVKVNGQDGFVSPDSVDFSTQRIEAIQSAYFAGGPAANLWSVLTKEQRQAVLTAELGGRSVDPADYGFPELKMSWGHTPEWVGQVRSNGELYELSARPHVEHTPDGPDLVLGGIELIPLDEDGMYVDMNDGAFEHMKNGHQALIRRMFSQMVTFGAEQGWTDVRLKYERASWSTSANKEDARDISLRSRLEKKRATSDLEQTGHRLGQKQETGYDLATHSMQVDGTLAKMVARKLFEKGMVDFAITCRNGEVFDNPTEQQIDLGDIISISCEDFANEPIEFIDLRSSVAEAELTRRLVPGLSVLPADWGFPELHLDHCGFLEWSGIVKSQGKRYDLNARITLDFTEEGPTLVFRDIGLIPEDFDDMEKYKNLHGQWMTEFFQRVIENGARMPVSDIRVQYDRASWSTSANKSRTRDISLQSRLKRAREDGEIGETGHSLQPAETRLNEDGTVLFVSGERAREIAQILYGSGQGVSVQLAGSDQFVPADSDNIHGDIVAIGEVTSSYDLLTTLGVHLDIDFYEDLIESMLPPGTSLNPADYGFPELQKVGSSWSGRISDGGVAYSMYASTEVQFKEGKLVLVLGDVAMVPMSGAEGELGQGEANKHRALMSQFFKNVTENGARMGWDDIRVRYTRADWSTSANKRDSRDLSLQGRMDRMRQDPQVGGWGSLSQQREKAVPIMEGMEPNPTGGLRNCLLAAEAGDNWLAGRPSTPLGDEMRDELLRQDEAKTVEEDYGRQYGAQSFKRATSESELLAGLDDIAVGTSGILGIQFLDKHTGQKKIHVLNYKQLETGLHGYDFQSNESASISYFLELAKQAARGELSFFTVDTTSHNVMESVFQGTLSSERNEILQAVKSDGRMKAFQGAVDQRNVDGARAIVAESVRNSSELEETKRGRWMRSFLSQDWVAPEIATETVVVDSEWSERFGESSEERVREQLIGRLFEQLQGHFFTSREDLHYLDEFSPKELQGLLQLAGVNPRRVGWLLGAALVDQHFELVRSMCRLVHRSEVIGIVDWIKETSPLRDEGLLMKMRELLAVEGLLNSGSLADGDKIQIGGDAVNPSKSFDIRHLKKDGTTSFVEVRSRAVSMTTTTGLRRALAHAEEKVTDAVGDNDKVAGALVAHFGGTDTNGSDLKVVNEYGGYETYVRGQVVEYGDLFQDFVDELNAGGDYDSARVSQLFVYGGDGAVLGLVYRASNGRWEIERAQAPFGNQTVTELNENRTLSNAPLDGLENHDPTLDTIAGFAPGTVFSGTYIPFLDYVFCLPSEGAKWADGSDVTTPLKKDAGHQKCKDAAKRYLTSKDKVAKDAFQGENDKFAAFSVKLREDGKLEVVTWQSPSVNLVDQGQLETPIKHRQPLMDALAVATGREVVESEEAKQANNLVVSNAPLEKMVGHDLNQDIMGNFSPGTVFSGVYIPTLDYVFSLPSAGAKWADGEFIEDSVVQYGGHGACKRAAKSYLLTNGIVEPDYFEQGDNNKFSALTMTLKDDGSLEILSWNSFSVNHMDQGQQTTPKQYRQKTLDALTKATGRVARESERAKGQA